MVKALEIKAEYVRKLLEKYGIPKKGEEPDRDIYEEEELKEPTTETDTLNSLETEKAEQPKEALKQIETKDSDEVYTQLAIDKPEYRDVLERMRAKGIKLDYKNPETLRYLYEKEGENLSTYKMAELFEVSQKTIWKCMKKHEIPRRGHFDEKGGIVELNRPENAKWLAAVLDTEGAIGWSKYTRRTKYKNKEYVYICEIPYIDIEMTELESKRTVDEAACFIGATSRTVPSRGGYRPKRETRASHKRALTVLHYTEQYLDKFKRMAPLLQTLFKYHTELNRERFRGVITALFGKYVTSDEANDILLKMTEEEFNTFIQRAEKLTKEFLF